MQPKRTSKRLLFFLVSAVVLLTLAGVGLLAAYFLLSRQPAETVAWVNPVTVVDSEKTAPDIAVLTLAGEPDDRVVRAALDAGEVESAYATLAYALLIPDSLRGGNWLLLAREAQARDPARAQVCYQAAFDLASLGPTLNDLARADISLQVAAGYAGLDRAWIARLSLAQAENIARYSPTILPAQRRNLLTQVAQRYRELDDMQMAQAIEGRLEEYAAGPGVVVAAPPALLPSLRGTVVLPTPVMISLAARQQAAAGLAARWLSAGPGTRDTLAQALSQALRNEDDARAAFYDTADTLELADRLALLHDQAVWLTIKARAARGDYGLLLVPEWESDTAAIDAELAGVYTALINGYGQQLDTLDEVEGVQARVELLRQGLLWARLGLFSDTAEQALSEQLADASRQLWTRQGGVGLTLVAQDVQGELFYLLAGSESALTPQAAQ
jgi:hypothetical protein